MRLLGFEKMFLAALAVALVFMGLYVYSFYGELLNLSKITTQVILYGMIICSAFMIISVMAPVAYWRQAKLRAPFGILGFLEVALLFAWFAVVALYSMETMSALPIRNFAENHFMPLTIMSCISLAVYIIWEREKILQATA